MQHCGNGWRCVLVYSLTYDIIATIKKPEANGYIPGQLLSRIERVWRKYMDFAQTEIWAKLN